jgi:nicotinamidase-related amidase
MNIWDQIGYVPGIFGVSPIVVRGDKTYHVVTTSMEANTMKKALVVVDYQNDFVTGSLGFPGAVELEDRIADKILENRRNGCEVIFTLDTHDEHYSETQEGKKLPVPHCIKGTKGWELYGRVAICCEDTDTKFEKNAFGSLELAEYLAKSKFKTVEFVGLVSNICVISNAVLAKAALPEAEIVVDSSCTASADGEMNRHALEIMKGLQINVI